MRNKTPTQVLQKPEAHKDQGETFKQKYHRHSERKDFCLVRDWEGLHGGGI